MRDDIIDWIALSRIPGIGSLRYQYLIESFGSPIEVFKGTKNDLSNCKGIDLKTAVSILENKGCARDYALKDFDFIQKNNIDIITFKDDTYPNLLKHIYNFPVLLYIQGRLLEQDQQSLAIVGSRKATTYGLMTAKKLSGDLVSRGFTIISGMARGIDSISHLGALEGNGRTIAILGNGIDICYPRENRNLMDAVISNGAILSEFPIGTPPEQHNFPQRNRIISGLSMGVIIVEAHEKSGALITADIALQQGKEVFAVPGNITADSSRGTNRLIKQGAKLVESIDDILEELSPHLLVKLPLKSENHPPSIQVTNLSDCETKILSVLSNEPIHVDVVSERTGYSTAELSQFLLNLELLGYVTQLSGKRFVKSIQPVLNQ